MVAGRLPGESTALSATEMKSRQSITIDSPAAWSVGLGLFAGWLAAGSLGILSVSLQSISAWMALAAAFLCARPRVTPRGVALFAGVIGGLVLLPLVIAPVRLGLPLTVGVAMCLLSAFMSGTGRRVMLVGALAVLVLALFRFAQQSLPAVWMMSDWLGGLLGRGVGLAARRPLVIGASFAGIDFLVVLAVFLGGWLTLLRRPRLESALFAVFSVLVVHAFYLVLLAFTHELLRALPPVVIPASGDPYVPPPFSWSRIVQQALPWNLPAVAGLLHALLVVVLVRSGSYRADESSVGEAVADPALGGTGLWKAATAVLVAASACLPLFATWRTLPELEGKRILANQKGQLDWNVPQHESYGQDTAGMYGLLPRLVESWGGQLAVSAELSRAELDSADVVLLLNPDTSLSLEQQDRIWQYVRDGGSLLVVTEGFLPENGLERRVSEVLQPVSIAVRRDAAVSQTKSWFGSMRALEHPATTWACPPTARPWSDAGASLDVRWPARPLLVGVWGWSAPEQAATWADSQSFQPGAKLGDLVLAAEQQVGAGRVIVLGDNTGLLNEGLAHSHAGIGGVLSYLASPVAGPQVFWRQALTALCLAGLLVSLVWRPTPARLACSGILLACFLAAGQKYVAAGAALLPDGARIAAEPADEPWNRLAYIDATHAELYSMHAWEVDALDGLTLNLQRNGYLPLMLHELTADRLARAGLLICIAPARQFSSAECAHVRTFVEEGGVLVALVGAEEADASRDLLAQFGLRVPSSPVPTVADAWEPEPFGRTRAGYLEVAVTDADRYQASVRLRAAWPVESVDGQAEVLAYGRNQLPVVESETQLPVILSRLFGRGEVVLIGDSSFALNRNLEYIGGEPFAGDYENARFWRWLLTEVRGLPEWVPPRPVQGAADADADEDADEVEEEEL